MISKRSVTRKQYNDALIQVRVPAALKVLATEAATRKGMTFSKLAREALETCILAMDVIKVERDAAELDKRCRASDAAKLAAAAPKRDRRV